MSLKNALLLIVLLTVLFPIAVIGLVTDRFLFQDLRDDIFRQNRSLAALVAGEVSSHLVSQLKIIRHLAKQLDENPALQDNRNLSLILDAQIAADEFFESILVLDGKGRVRNVGYQQAADINRQNYLGIDYTGQDFHLKENKVGDVYWSDTFISPISGEPTVSVSVPIRSGYLVANVHLKSLMRLARQPDSKSNRYIYMVNRRGTIIAHPDPDVARQQLNVSNLPIVRDGLGGVYGTYRYSVSGQETEATAVKIPQTGWLVVVAQNMKLAYAPVKRAELIFISGLIAVLILSVLAALWGLNKILIPLNLLVTNAQRLTEGNYSFDPVPANFKEIEELSGSFACMADAINRREETLTERNEELAAIEEELRKQIDDYLHSQDELAKSHGEINRLNRDLERRVAERTEQLELSNKELAREINSRRVAQQEINILNENLLARSAALEAANKELESFCYSVSHDLRAPLRHINGFSQALLEDALDGLDEQGQNYLRRICAATDRMGLLIDALLNLSRVSRDEMKNEQVDLSELAASIIESLKESEPQREVSSIIAPHVVVSGDRNLLGAVMQNLIGNAWKYTSKKDEAVIEFGIQTTGSEKIYYVRDNGVGFNMAYAGKLFGAFQRLHGEAEFEGTGIGLATVQRIIHRHRGRVWGEGETGKGATFYFTLPE